MKSKCTKDEHFLSLIKCEVQKSQQLKDGQADKAVLACAGYYA